MLRTHGSWPCCYGREGTSVNVCSEEAPRSEEDPESEGSGQAQPGGSTCVTTYWLGSLGAKGAFLPTAGFRALPTGSRVAVGPEVPFPALLSPLCP